MLCTSRSWLLPGRISVVALTAAALVAAGCGSSSKSSGSTATSQAPATDASTTAAATGGSAEAKAFVEAAMKEPQWQSPGPAFDASKAKGKTVAIVAVGEAVPAVKELDDDMVAAFKEVGVKTTVGDGKFSPTEFVRLMQQAIQTKAAAIILNAVDPKAVAQPLRQAKAAGVPVITMFEADPAQPLPEGVVGRADFSYKNAGELLAAWTASDSQGKADALAIQSSDAPSAAALVGGLKSGWSKYCSGCTLKLQDVAVADWQTRLGPTVRSGLLANPKTNYVVPIYDGMVLNVAPAIGQAGAGSRVRMASLNATPAVMKLMQQGKIQMEIGESNPWLAWAAVDQALRAAAGSQPVADEHVPLRVFTQDNFPSGVGSASDPSTWYGSTDFKGEYRKLWQIG
jgi:ribose transport system substrate-binding protein